jgi:hypothetical protein
LNFEVGEIMELLPNDILVKILNELSIAGIVTCLASCKKLNEQNYENLWKSKCLEFGIPFDTPSACESNIRIR